MTRSPRTTVEDAPVPADVQARVDSGLRAGAYATMALVALFVGVAAWLSGPAAIPLVLTAGCWALVAGIATQASGLPATILTGPVQVLGGVVAAAVAAWALGLDNPSVTATSAGVAAANALAVTFHPFIRGRVRPARSGPLAPALHAIHPLRRGDTVHLALIPADDRPARLMMRLAASRLTAGHPALCGTPTGNAEGVCPTCAASVVEAAAGRVSAGGRTVTWDPKDPVVGLIAVTASADPEQERP